VIIIDTSVWIDHFREGNAALKMLLLQQQVVQHPFITAEILLGNVRERENLQNLLNGLPQTAICDSGQLFDIITDNKLYGCGIGVVDAHILAATLKNGHQLWTRDKRLANQSQKLGCCANID
jgi:predicted nucleic acid-binding protein